MASLTVGRRALLATLRSLARLTRPDSSGDAILSLVDGALEIAIGGAVGSVAAAGSWPGACRVSGRWVRSLVTGLPAGAGTWTWRVHERHPVIAVDSRDGTTIHPPFSGAINA
jgi:hypothetical protein